MSRSLLFPLCLLLLGCGGGGGGGRTTVERILDDTLGVPWHQWAQVADMDSDGNPDIVTVSHIPDNDRAAVNVFVRQPGGTYQKQTVTLGSQPRDRVSHVLVVDLNVDGLPDVVASHIGFTAAGSTPGRFVRVLLKSGQAAIDFEPPVAYAVGDNPVIAAAGDVDLDGLPDIAVATHSGVDLLLQDGGNPGRFLAARRISSASAAAVRIADMNGDGLPDLLSAGDGGVRLFVNDLNEPAAFRSSSLWPVSSWPCGITVGDFNADGWLDFATCHTVSDTVAQSSVARRLQDPLQPGTFGANVELSHGQSLSVSSIDSADLNDDGRDDLVIAIGNGLDGVSIGVHLAAPSGAFESADYFNDGAVSGPWSASIGQLGPDDLHDVVLAHALDGVYTHPGNGDGSFEQARRIVN